MQLCLSHLVDLALGRPEVVGGENFNVLHTLLHVILKKLNLGDSPVEITEQHAEKAQWMLDQLPKEPSICFREFTFRNGVRVKKRVSHQVTAKRSIVQINKKWPKSSPIHCNSPVTPPATPPPAKEQVDTKGLLEDLEALGQRVICLESKLSEVTLKCDAQNRFNCCALQDFEELKSNFESLSCEFHEFKKSSESVEEEQENESDCENEENEMDCVEEIKWLKERMLEFSESLKIQSECLKNIKCLEMPQIKGLLEEKLELFEKSLEALKRQHMQDVEMLKAFNGNDLKEMKTQFECFKCQISCITCQLQDFEKQFVENQEMTCDELCTLRVEIMEKIQKTFTAGDSQRSSCEIQSMTKQDDRGSECSLKFTESQSGADQSSQAVCISITQRLCHIQKQVMSQSVCMQQLVRDLACKVDRREFECHCRKISDTIDTLLQLKQDLQSAGANAAGTCVPMSCISCQTSANMTITTSNVPKLPPLRYGRENILAKCPQDELGGCSCKEPQKAISNANWNCYNFQAGPRKAGGSHTKVNRVMQVCRMRYRRLKTPCCAASRLNCCKADFKRKSSVF